MPEVNAPTPYVEFVAAVAPEFGEVVPIGDTPERGGIAVGVLMFSAIISLPPPLAALPKH